MRFQNKVVIVTGSSRGIGEAAARAFAEEGAQVVITSSHIKDCKRVAQEIGGFAVECDVSKPRHCEYLVRQVVKKFGRIDVLVNNAGVFQNVRVEDMSEKEWDRVVNINLKGPFLLSKVVIPHLKNGATIVNVASVLGLIADPRTGAYSASKGGLIQLTKVLALELAERGIRVNAVAPGPINTAMLGGIKDPAVKKEFLDWVPLRRVGEPVEIAKAILFLASDDASFITGHCLVADGGGTAQ